MSKEKVTAICPICNEAKNVIKKGKRNNIQRFYCKKCKKVFQQTYKQIKYSTNEKTLLAVLVSILQAPKGARISETLGNVERILKNINDYRIIEHELPSIREIKCLNPRLLICENNTTISLYKLNSETWNQNSIVIKDGRIRPKNKIKSANDTE